MDKMKPYERNTYFILDLPLAAVNALLKHCVGTSPLELYDGSYLVKLPMDADIPEAFNAHTALTHAEMKVEKGIREH